MSLHKIIGIHSRHNKQPYLIRNHKLVLFYPMNMKLFFFNQVAVYLLFIQCDS